MWVRTGIHKERHYCQARKYTLRNAIITFYTHAALLQISPSSLLCNHRSICYHTLWTSGLRILSACLHTLAHAQTLLVSSYNSKVMKHIIYDHHVGCFVCLISATITPASSHLKLKLSHGSLSSHTSDGVTGSREKSFTSHLAAVWTHNSCFRWKYN